MVYRRLWPLFSLLSFWWFSRLAGAYLITSDPTPLVHQTFDYVIVGGGTAGLTVANRLTENEGVSVLVIEAGRDEKNDTRVTDPGQFGLGDITNLTWGYSTTNQSVGGRVQQLTVGKALGGSSSINGMQWTRGSVAQYNALEKLGNPGWNFSSLQKYMKRAEYFHAPNAAQVSLGVTFSPSAHGTSGNVVTGFPDPYPCPACKIWDVLIDSAGSVFPDLRTTGDLDQCSGDPRGAARCSYSIIPGSKSRDDKTSPNLRSSSAQSYVYSLPLEARPNLSILVEHQAARIFWDTSRKGELPKPQGVQIITQNSTSPAFMVNVKKEVIISSGTLGTPKFLELSGIGNKTILQNLGIPVTVDLPAVGTNLQDQSGAILAYNPISSLNTSIPNAPPAGAAAFLTLSQVLGNQTADAHVQSLRESLNQRAKDIVTEGAGVNQIGVQNQLEQQLNQFGEHQVPVVEIVYLAAGDPSKVIVAAAWILLPQYRGTVHVSSSDPRVSPAINPNYLGTSQDFSLLVNASMAVRRVFSSPSAKTLYSSELVPGPAVQSDDQWHTFVENNYSAVLHPIGTASMLPRELGGVVDSRLKVYGVQGVRVVDASILPIQLSAHLSSTVYGIAEKAADMIKGTAP